MNAIHTLSAEAKNMADTVSLFARSLVPCENRFHASSRRWDLSLLGARLYLSDRRRTSPAWSNCLPYSYVP